MSDAALAEQARSVGRAAPVRAPWWLTRRGRGVRGSLLSFLDQLLVSGCNFLTTVLIARALGLDDFGAYTLIWLTVLFFTAMQLGFVVSPMMSIGPKQDRPDAAAYFGTVILHEIAFCTIATLGIAAVVGLLSRSAQNTLMLPVAGAAAGAGFLVQDFTRRFLYTRMRPHIVLALDALNQAVKLALLAWLWSIGMLGIAAALWVVAGAAGLASVVALPFLGPLSFRRAHLGTITVRQWQSAKWLVATGLMHWLMANSAILITGGLLGTRAVGAWRAAQTILGTLHIIREAIDNILPQAAGRALASRGLPGLRAVLIAAAAISFSLGLGLVTVLVVYGGQVLRFIYGPEFEQYGFVIAWLSLTFPAALLICVVICAFRALEQTSVIFWASAVTAAFNLALIYPAVLFFGVSGAIAVVLATDLLALGVLTFYLLRVFAGWRESVASPSGAEQAP